MGVQSRVYAPGFGLFSIYTCRGVLSRCIQWFCDVYCCDYTVLCSVWNFQCFSAVTDVLVDYLTDFYNNKVVIMLRRVSVMIH